MQEGSLKYLMGFLQSEDISKAEIFGQLKSSKEEAEILRFLTKEYLNGSSEMTVYDLLMTVYETKEEDFSYVEKIPLIKNILHQGWIILHTFHHTKTNELSQLEILHLSVSLSTSFLKILENGNLDLVMPEIKAYEDNLEYLQDQFFRVDLYQNLAIIRQSYDQSSPNYKRVRHKLTMLEHQIEQRLKETKETPKVEEYMKTNKLEDKERIIFLALLKEEYSSTDENLRDMNTLIEMVSMDEYEKIKNRSLLEENSGLIEKQIIDYDEVLTAFGGISRSFFISEDVLSDIIHPTAKKEKKSKKIRLDVLVKEQDIFELVEPKTTLSDVILHPKTREMLDTIMKQMDKTVANRLKDWGIKDKKSGMEAKILFHGHPGTGKTMTALSMAKTLKKQIVSFDCSKILSMYIGESEKNVRKIFDSYKDIATKSKSDPVLLLNEADQFLSSRTTSAASSADKMHNQMQNIFLEQIESFDGILIATTNLLETFDQAFSRRFNYKIKFEKPNLEQRKQLWHKMIPTNAEVADDVSIDALSQHDLTGGQINLIVKNTAFKVATKEEPIFTQSDFLESVKKEISGTFGEDATVGFLS